MKVSKKTVFINNVDNTPKIWFECLIIWIEILHNNGLYFYASKSKVIMILCVLVKYENRILQQNI